MILHLQRFLATEQPFWAELEGEVKRFEADPQRRLSSDEAARFFFLYQRAAHDLARLGELAGRPEIRDQLEGLVRRAYAETYNRANQARFSPRRFLFSDFPQAFRRRIGAFILACAITLGGVLFGGAAMVWDPGAKAVLMPFAPLMETPGERVHREETQKANRIDSVKSTFAAQLITHNIQVAFFTFALGMSWGVGSIIMLFYNGVTLGAVMADYVGSGYSLFLSGWLLPHGVIEIPAILIAGQAGLLLGGALLGWSNDTSRRDRLLQVRSDLLALAGGIAVLLFWAGIVEAFLSQYHQPVVPYVAKIGFGIAELFLLVAWLGWSGSRQSPRRQA